MIKYDEDIIKTHRKAFWILKLTKLYTANYRDIEQSTTIRLINN